MSEPKDGPWCHCGQLMTEHKPWGSCTNPKEMKKPTCEHEGCDREGFECTFASEPDEGECRCSFYCGEHAADNGYCCVCGIFSAGIESFDFLHPGYCDNCYYEVRDADDDDPDWDYCDY